jgi:hypothetical protein
MSLSLLAAMFGAATASAQFFDPALHALDLSTGPVARSPRLLGMGGLVLAMPDRDTNIELWDFAGMPVGLAADDTTSTLDLRPATDALSSVSRLPAGRERQELAARSTLAQMEAVYRNHDSGSVFAIVGDLSSLRWDRPFARAVEVREGLLHPQVMPVLGGVVPKILDGHLAWATHLRFRSENVEDQYRQIVVNAAGEYIDLAGGQLPPPGQFAPTNTDVTTTAFGLSTAYTMGRRTRLGLGIEHENNNIDATNDLPRSSSETSESRPYWIGQAALVGGFGRTFEYGVSGIGRLANSEEDWRFTTSAGVGADPLTGRGNLLTREEKSSELHARARWSPGRLTLAGALNTGANRITIDPPHANDPTSLNRFIDAAFNRPGADTLSLPDSVVHGQSRRYALGWGGGASYRFGRSTVGVEGNWLRDVSSTLVLGTGPRRIAWDVRAGLERPLGAQMKGRIGYIYHWVDEDDYTAGNEYKGNAVSLGFGYAPAGSSWSLESGYVLEFRSTDFSDPAGVHQSRQNLALQLHWAL